MAPNEESQAGSKNCPQCGAPLRTSDLFCMQCGLRLDEEPGAQAVPSAAPAAAAGSGGEAPPAKGRRGKRVEGRIDFREVINYPFSEGELTFFKAAIPFTLMVTIGLVLCLLSFRAGMLPYFLAIIPFSIAGGYAMTTLQHHIRESISSLFIQRNSSLRQNVFVVSIPVTVGMVFLLVLERFYGLLAHTLGGGLVAAAVCALVMGLFSFVTLIVLAHYAAEGTGLTGLDYRAVKDVARANWPGFLAVLVFWVTGLVLLVPAHLVFVILGIYCLLRYRGKPRKMEGLSFLVDLERRLVLTVYDKLVGRKSLKAGQKPGLARAALATLIAMLFILLITWVASLYWLTTVSARLLAHMYRGEKIEFRRSELEL